MRAAFTLIEVLVALVILEFGMLALLTTAAVAARDLGVAERRSRARTMATNRVEHLRSLACETTAAGVASAPGGLTEFWRVEGDGSRRVIHDSVAIAAPRGRTHSVVIQAWVLCAP